MVCYGISNIKKYKNEINVKLKSIVPLYEKIKLNSYNLGDAIQYNLDIELEKKLKEEKKSLTEMKQDKKEVEEIIEKLVEISQKYAIDNVTIPEMDYKHLEREDAARNGNIGN